MGIRKVSEERPGSEEDEETEAENKATAKKKHQPEENGFAHV